MLAVPNWVIGIIFSFMGCFLSNFGVNVQKLAHMRRMVSGNNESSLFCNPIWLLGFLGVVVGSLLDLVSFYFASISLLAPLGALTLAINLCVAPCFLKEHLSKNDVIYTLVIVSGTVVSIIFGPKVERTYTTDTLLDAFFKPTFIFFACFFFIALMAVYFVLRRIEHRLPFDDPVKEAEESMWEIKFQSFVYPAVAGIWGSMLVLFAKSSAEVVRASINGSNQFGHIFTWIEVILVFVAIFFQVRFLNLGLDKADALLVVPVYQVFWVVMNVLTGMIYFDDFESMTTWALILFSIGVFVTLLGVLFLAQRPPTAVTHAIAPPSGTSPASINVDLELAPDLLIVEPMSHREAVAVIVNPAGTLLLMELGSHAHTTAPAELVDGSLEIDLHAGVELHPDGRSTGLHTSCYTIVSPNPSPTTNNQVELPSPPTPEQLIKLSEGVPSNLNSNTSPLLLTSDVILTV